jgi:CRP-like cAMP-binding protein
VEDIFADGKAIHFSKDELVPVKKYVYFMQEGAVGQYTAARSGKRLLLAYKPGESFPYDDNTSLNRKKIFFRAISKSRALQLPRTAFKKQLEKKEYAAAFLESLLRINQLQLSRIDNLQEEQIVYRLLERLVFICDRFGTPDGDKVSIDIPMSHVDLAAAINTTRETVNRYMKHLDRLGVIRLRNQKIKIESLSRVRSILENQSLQLQDF